MWKLPATMRFTHNGRVYALPAESVVMDGMGDVPLAYDQFVSITDKSRGFCAETFLNTEVHGKTIAQQHILVVQTSAGMVWASRLAVDMTASEREQFGLAGSTVGQEFVWAWNPGKSTVSWLRFRDAEKMDGRYRTLAHLSPERLTMAVGLQPELIDGCEEVPWSELTADQRFFLSHIDPTSYSLGMSSNVEKDEAYVAEALVSIDNRRRRLCGNGAEERVYMKATSDMLVETEAMEVEECEESLFFGTPREAHDCDVVSGRERVDHVADWTWLPVDVARMVLATIADDAFRSDWQNHEAAQAVARLRLVCRRFRDDLDGRLTELWTENAQFSRRVLKGSLCERLPPVMPSIGLATIISAAARADTWRKLARLRQVAGVKRKQRPPPFVFRGEPRRRLTFGECNRADVDEMQNLNDAMRVQKDVYFA